MEWKDRAEGKQDRIVVECEIDSSPETLWRALTEEELASDWLGASPTGASEGVCFEILEATRHSRIRYAWHDPEHPDAPPVVTVEIEQLPTGRTRLRLIHGVMQADAPHSAAANTNRLALAA